MPHYRWAGSDTFRDHAHDRDVEPGDVVELPERVGDPQPEFVRVEESAAAASEESGAEAEEAEEAEEVESEGEAAVEPPVDPGEFSVSDLRDHLSEADYDAAELDALEAAERDGDDRTTAYDAIDAARPAEE